MGHPWQLQYRLNFRSVILIHQPIRAPGGGGQMSLGYGGGRTNLGIRTAVRVGVSTRRRARGARGDAYLGKRTAHIARSTCVRVRDTTGLRWSEAVFSVRAAVLGWLTNGRQTEPCHHALGHMSVTIIIWVALITTLGIAPPDKTKQRRKTPKSDRTPKKMSATHWCLAGTIDGAIPCAWRVCLGGFERAAGWELGRPIRCPSHDREDVDRGSLHFPSSVDQRDQLRVDRVDHSLVRADGVQLHSEHGTDARLLLSRTIGYTAVMDYSALAVRTSWSGGGIAVKILGPAGVLPRVLIRLIIDR